MEEPEISNYALIGNSCAAALVSGNGSIDWCCLPEFDSPAIFAALLDRENGGYFCIRPATEFQSSHQYVPDTNVYQNTFTTDTGQARLTDAFTVMTEAQKQRELYADHEILRVVEGISGTVKMKMEYLPRIFYGRSRAFLQDNIMLGISFTWKENIFNLLTTLPPAEIRVSDHSKAEVEFDVSPGERIFFSFSHCVQAPAVIPELKETAASRMANTLCYWRNWIGKCRYSGLYSGHVKRSALALKLLTHSPSGAIVAAPTASLPEKMGGQRNWDYRYCWLRDASFTTRVLLKLGFEDEVHAYMNWILHATQLTRPALQVVYSVYGHVQLREHTLHWLSGYRGSAPVRIGNRAYDQLQLDVYGEVLDAIYSYSRLVEKFDRDSRKFMIGLGERICKVWNRPDNGIWEIRSSTIHHTHSKVMCWVGLDRLIKICSQYGWKEAPLQMFSETMGSIHNEIERSGYDAALASYTRGLGVRQLDASALTFPLVGYTEFSSPRMRSTTEAIRSFLSDNGMIYRYSRVEDGVGGEEGAFALCNFWMAENLARAGSLDDARSLFDATVAAMGSAGLLSEEIDPVTGKLLGNYPQAFTHIGLINAALAINEQQEKNKLKQGETSLQR
jgi:GH15 family glucan-1,4-alpha-glucosidase